MRGRVDAAAYPGRDEGGLLEQLKRRRRFDDAIEAVKHTFDDLHEGNLLRAMILLAEAGHHAKALELTEGRSPEFLAENDAFWLRSNRVAEGRVRPQQRCPHRDQSSAVGRGR